MNSSVHDTTDESPPPNRAYAARHRDTIRFLHARGMSRRHIEAIYGRQAVAIVLDPNPSVTPGIA